MSRLLKQVQSLIEAHQLLRLGDTVVAAVSGGPDSLCLLHLLCRLRAEYRLTLVVAHLHHGLRGADADADADFVQTTAREWGLSWHVERCDVRALADEHSLALEEAARRARYGFLTRVAEAEAAGAVAVGHNADDQAETILMHWMRGAALAGLRGMLPVTDLRGLRELREYRLFDQVAPAEVCGGSSATVPSSTPLRLIRPLLEVHRCDIKAYCRFHGLDPRFDRSNLDTTLFRNWLRHEVLPLMAQHNPSIRAVIRRSARVIADDYSFLREQLGVAWPGVVAEETEQYIRFRLGEWRELPVSLQRSTLREAIHRLRRSLRNINFVHVENALDMARNGSTGNQATLPRDLVLRVDYHSFSISDADWVGPMPDWPLLVAGQGPAPIRVPGDTPLVGSEWVLRVQRVKRKDLPAGWAENTDAWRAYLDDVAVEKGLWLRTRQPGDRFQPLGMHGRTVKLGDFLTNQKVSRPVRERLPLLVTEQEILWVCGQRLDDRASLRANSESALVLEFLRH